ncbi:mechanosensitive ion channel [Candidatus Woesearchaeota archaeon]|nr:mechanosensitive ion channel [Candidatus Woesearchaeota archaeon]
MVDIISLWNTIVENSILYLPKVIGAVFVLLIGLWVVGIISKIFDKSFARKKMEPSLRHFLTSLVRISLKILVFVTAISMLGVQMTSFIAIIGAAGLAVGLALQGSLANFAGGVLILLFKPFKVDDVIEAQGFLGKVNNIQIFNTILKTPDNKTVVIPNGHLSNGPITNYTTEEQRRVDFSFGISYSDNIDKAKKVISDVIKKDKRILKTPEPFVMVGELADSSVNLTTRVWCKGADYWDVHFNTIENVKKALDENSISIPFPQRDVHMIK